MAEPVLYGAAYSVYVRAVRLALEEKGVAYHLHPVDIFAEDGPPAEHLARQPFGKIPAFEHGRVQLYESDAIMRYVDAAFAGPSLVPADVVAQAQMTQLMRIMDNYGYPHMVWGVFIEQVRAPQSGRKPDKAKLDASTAIARKCLSAITEIKGKGPFLLGQALSLADLLAAPMFVLFERAPMGRTLLNERPVLARWLDDMQARESLKVTR